ncbi:hypothetical protein OIO90_003529 [Microbotryomycetes sp. JL221]|nr:hypothetical protein OIO90_003529 [Microbotryomycetes sp. JL221]
MIGSTLAAQQQPARILCGTTEPDQSVCDRLSQPVPRRTMKVPIDSQCVLDSTTNKYFCGYVGARGGLGDRCQSEEGVPDDSMCLGNLACSSNKLGTPVCGGAGAECMYTAEFVPGATPNHAACISGKCDKNLLRCADRPREPYSTKSQKPLQKPQSWKEKQKSKEAVEAAGAIKAQAAAAEIAAQHEKTRIENSHKIIQEQKQMEREFAQAERLRRPQINFDRDPTNRPQDDDDEQDSRDHVNGRTSGDDDNDVGETDTRGHQISHGSSDWMPEQDDYDDEGEDDDPAHSDWSEYDDAIQFGEGLDDEQLDDETDDDEEYEAFKAFQATQRGRKQSNLKPVTGKSVEVDDAESAGVECPTGLTACVQPGSESNGLRKWTCVDIESSPNHCGGCLYPALSGFGPRRRGQDCLAQEGVIAASCIQGRCQAFGKIRKMLTA